MQEKTNFYVVIALFLVVLATFALVYTQYQRPITIAQSGPGGEGIPKISASGTSELQVMPDEAIMRIKVETRAKTAKEAQDQNSKTMAQVQSALKRAGIASDKIETDQYNLYPWHEWDNVQQKTIEMGYTLYHTIKVTTTDLDKVGEFISVAVDAGANGVENVQFDLSDKKKEQVRRDALQQAAQNAKAKAETIAAGLGVKLGAIQDISESSFNYGPIYRGYAEMAVKADMGAAMPAPIEPEQISVQATVSVSYRIV
ncbi:MAG: SIMPL domain-containing protein [Candidatus Woesearchaeota archaeon]